MFLKANKKIRDKGMFFTYYKHGIRVWFLTHILDKGVLFKIPSFRVHENRY